MTAPKILIDQDLYPHEESLDAFEAHEFEPDCREAAQWLVEELPKLAEAIGYAACRRADHPERIQIEFATGGWSGAERLIESILAHTILRAAFYAAWKRGGLHVFEIPRSFLPEDYQ